MPQEDVSSGASLLDGFVISTDGRYLDIPRNARDMDFSLRFEMINGMQSIQRKDSRFGIKVSVKTSSLNSRFLILAMIMTDL
jgi:hypothetical protein